MIYEVRHYWVSDDALPTREDVEAAHKVAVMEKCTVRLNWKGPGFCFYGDTYFRDISPTSDVDEIMKTLPDIYAV